jgi:hypothetical protein
MANKFKEHDVVKVVRLSKKNRGVTGAQPKLWDVGTVVSGSGASLGFYLVENGDENGRAVWIAEFDEDELQIEMNDIEAERLLKKSTDRGLEIARDLINGSEKTAASAIILGTAAGALYWTLGQSRGYEQDAKNWLEAFFRTMIGGLKLKGVQLDVQWTRKEE